MSGTKINPTTEVIRDLDVVETCKATIENNWTVPTVQRKPTSDTISPTPDMPGIPKDIYTHKLNVDPLYPPVRQVRRKFNAAINEAVSEEVDKLLANGDAFGLKNAGATYQRLVTKMFKEQLGKTMEVYIDDMLVKSVKKEDHIDHLKKAFEILRQYGMKLNPEKCAFGVASGKFLGFLVSQRGIEVNPDQIKAIDTIPEVLHSKKQCAEERSWTTMEQRMHRGPEEIESIPIFATTARQSRPRRVPACVSGSIRSRCQRRLGPQKQRDTARGGTRSPPRFCSY
ncbi:PREDICTED: uncharacterized protein LOC109235935 [Nicotiana attenuata]|uniref:uncharacterized protein LOC109235935 n=1 Tax=Nicotiana attenuata TaxID=49451 RepID=UPI000904E9D5|nr:PREDICTED: uncharacterized protein LOC109235935 [Nicotiana attenuata]